MPNNSTHLDKIFHVLADPTRRSVVERLSSGPAWSCRTVLRSPEGEDFPGVGCCLEVVENERLVFTDALGPGFRPVEGGFFTAMILLESHGAGTKYTAIAMHKDEATRQVHEEMGFHAGRSECLDQLVALVKAGV